MTSWERLGIAPTTDKKAIKKAYAARVKDCHQEDEPERWAQLHDAYKSALKYAEAGGGQSQKTYTVYREQGKDFLHGEQAKPVYHSPWEQPETEKPELRKQEERKPEFSKEEAKPKPRKEEAKPELPKGEPKPEPRDADRELIEFFDHMLENAKESEQKFMAQLRAQLEELSQALPEEEARKWKEFFKSPVSQKLYRSEDYWSAVFAVFYKKELQKGTYQIIYGELQHILSTHSLEMSMVLKSRIESCMKICESHIKKKEEKAQKKRQKLIGICWVLGIFLFVYFITMFAESRNGYNGSNTEITSKRAVQTQLAAYLNEKYVTGEYQAEAFELEYLEKKCVEDGRQNKVAVGYKVTLPEQEDFLAYVLFKYDSKKKIVGAICFDNIQRNEIEYALTEEIKGRLGVSQAEGYLSEGENYFTAGILPEDDAVYNTLFAGDLTQFAEAEKSARAQIRGRYAMIDTYLADGEMNGSFLLYYADAQVPDIRTRVDAENAANTANGQIAAELATLQEELHIQMVAVGLTQSYYGVLFENTEEKTDAYILRAAKRAGGGNVPLNPAMVSVWFADFEDNAVTMWQQEEIMAEVSNPWIHVPKVTELEEGIYALPRVEKDSMLENAGDVLEVKLSEADHRLQIFVNEEYRTQYVIVLDKEKLGIGEKYQVELRNEEGEREVTYAMKPYTDLNYVMMSYTALDGEGMLLVDCEGWSGKIIDICWQP